jgi:hypothetical protein
LLCCPVVVLSCCGVVLLWCGPCGGGSVLATQPPMTLETIRAKVCLTDAAFADSAIGRALAAFDALFKVS